jgi:hypothetical protein
MAGSKVSNFALGDSNIQSVMLTLDKTFKGQHQVSLTNYNTTAESQVAAGSGIEIGGALYKFDSNESITGTPSDGTVYIMAVPSGDSVTCAYTNTAPTWSDSKQGWYGTVGTANNRYLEFVLLLDSTLWKIKENLHDSSKSRRREHLLYYAGGSQTAIASPATKVLFPNKKYDFSNLGNFNTSTGDFTSKVSGIYSFTVYISASGGTLPYTPGLNYNIVGGGLIGEDGRNHVIFLEAGQTAYVRFANSGGTSTISATSYILIKKID